ncbi:SET domain-containing protein [Paenibacillus sp.]|uniref:SET domain-containing protein n=1 Tax=Paenibacillus sp. TaxID=58172 RepID=UPI002D6318B6|nr:SET domain-containing protein-lysine N-methyltransferase [Paenibacillus sp.]HZG58877.1 SET domain-containing protein-lysine N-methyltransferase [Paenibacillus sp.]
MLHPDTELRFINETIGFGVFATKRIPKGTITWALDPLDRHFAEADVQALDELRKAYFLKYSYRNQRGEYILCWDYGKYINHSFHANCVGTAYELELAARDIEAGEQLTSDYGTLNVDEPFDCEPEEGSERRQVLPDDLLRYADKWDRLAADAFRRFRTVEQPLLHLVKPEFLPKIERIVDLGEAPDSIRSFHYGGREPE